MTSSRIEMLTQNLNHTTDPGWRAQLAVHMYILWTCHNNTCVQEIILHSARSLY
ncbi:hypothetical protein DPMN_026420 [Dreissena polymorpha]|uniref:Uncharacterized protein n=1 Tax=Dreissena polymorpha TaxID=45954 RepID=A0A9D4REA1_DREPO|nr:hypothetical protein DPMN_026420 [Dreissena polymorpha]